MRRTAIIAAARTPVGRIRGRLAPAKVEDLAELVIREAVERAEIDPQVVDEVIYSNLYAHEISNMARYAALAAGLPNTVGGITVDRRCGSSLTAAALADCLIKCGDEDCIVTGGAEMDSRRPYVLYQQEQMYSIKPPVFRQGTRVAPAEMSPDNMGVTSENLAKLYGITRPECDAFAVASHKKAAAAWKNGLFDSQIVPVEIHPAKQEPYVFDKDEVVRPDCSMETLSRLKPSFMENGVSTAGNSSPMSDGASAVVLMAEDRAKALGCHILGYIESSASAGVNPMIMGVGPIYATKKLFEKTGLTMKDVDLVEMNEAFASQSIACMRELQIPEEKLNVNGGAIALGHPLAATGGILMTKMVYEMQRRDVNRGLITFCCGGGQGVSMLIVRE